MTELYFRFLIAISIIYVIKDWYRIEVLKKPIDHKRGFLLRACTCVTIALVLQDHEIIENLICTPIIMGFIFQYGLNLARRKPLLYLSMRGSDLWLTNTFKYPWLVFALASVLFVAAVIWKLI